ncbi:MAG: helix-hairpin-helix domain-containing protein [Phycisphaerales bacterium]
MRAQAAGHSGRLEAAQSLGFIVGSCVCLFLSAAFAAQVLDGAVPPPRLLPAERVNPNEASVASLARLPGIGATRARAIIAFRDRLEAPATQKAVFRCAEDLIAVRGIGPATIEGVRPWLRFDPPLEEGDSLPGR